MLKTSVSFPMIIIGLVGVIKGSMINIYSIKQRIMTIIIGIIAIPTNLLVLTNMLNDLLLNIVILSLTLIFNILSRAALYLSEFRLSIMNIKNFKIFFYIVSDYLIYIDKDGNIVLSKI